MISLLSTVPGGSDDALIELGRRAAVGALAADIAHDAGNSLFGLSGLIDLLREGELITARGRDLLRTAAEDLGSSLTPFLRFARGGDDEGARADLGATVREALDLYRHGDRRLLTIEEHVPAEPVRVDCPPSATLQAAVHLLLACHPVEHVELADGALTVGPAREPSFDEDVAGLVARRRGGTVVRADDALVLRLPPA